MGKPTFVLIHGAWHSSATWAEVVPSLVAHGHEVAALDLPGAGVNARQPASLDLSPFDPAAFATEHSPNAATSQEERTAAVLEVVRDARAAGNGKVVLVGHSLGGLTVSAVAEAAPELVHAAVFLTAAMLPAGATAIAVMQDTTMAEAKLAPLLMADPEQVGAMRIHAGSVDPAYLAATKEAFYGDVEDSAFAAFQSTLHCDEPVSVFVQPVAVTAARFGAVPRHYVRCLQDHTIPLSGQDHMIQLVDSSLGNKTIVHDLDSSHSPFLSQPDKLANLLLRIAA